MEKSDFDNGQSLETTPNEATTGLDSQSFFYASEQTVVRPHPDASEFIMRRMMEVQ